LAHNKPFINNTPKRDTFHLSRFGVLLMNDRRKTISMNLNIPTAMTTMQTESSEDLLVIISMKEDEPQEAVFAFSEFHRRFKKYVWKQAYMISGSLPCAAEDLAGTITNNVFLCVNDKAELYDSGKGQNVDSENRVKLWLNGIIKNEFKRMLFKYNEKDKLKESSLEVVYSNNPDFEVPLPESDLVPEEITIEKKCLESGLKMLSERERHILIIYTQFAEGKKQLPKNELERLASIYKTTSNNLRQIRRRAFIKLEKYTKNCSETKTK
jgi:DNA-directed RNA polymerase specialized sigma24 family protein